MKKIVSFFIVAVTLMMFNSVVYAQTDWVTDRVYVDDSPSFHDKRTSVTDVEAVLYAKLQVSGFASIVGYIESRYNMECYINGSATNAGEYFTNEQMFFDVDLTTGTHSLRCYTAGDTTGTWYPESYYQATCVDNQGN